MGRLVDADGLYNTIQIARDNFGVLGQSIQSVWFGIVANQPSVDAYSKKDYEIYLDSLQTRIKNFDSGCGWDGYIKKEEVIKFIQEEIDNLKMGE